MAYFEKESNFEFEGLLFKGKVVEADWLDCTELDVSSEDPTAQEWLNNDDNQDAVLKHFRSLISSQVNKKINKELAVAKNLDTNMHNIFEDFNDIIEFVKLILEKYPKATDCVLDILDIETDYFIDSLRLLTDTLPAMHRKMMLSKNAEEEKEE